MLDILYEDNHIIVVIKERGILSQEADKNIPDILNMVKDYIKIKYNKPGNVFLGLVHRLDINTKGIMVFAKTSKAAKRLFESINKKEFKKNYLAIVEGILDNNDYIKLINNIEKDENNHKAYISDSGKISILYYKALRNYKINNVDVTDIDILLESGRFHQIRCQMSNIGHPLYGDTKYGSKNYIDNESFPLIAYKLEFPHPITHEILKFEIGI